jgi:hypothetical protein
MQLLTLNFLGSSSEMAIFCDSALDWILECTSDPKGVSVLRAMALQMGTKFNFCDKHPSGVNFWPSKDRPLWPLPDRELAETYIDGMLCSEDPRRRKSEDWRRIWLTWWVLWMFSVFRESPMVRMSSHILIAPLSLSSLIYVIAS